MYSKHLCEFIFNIEISYSIKNHAKDKAFLSCLYILPETNSLKAL